MARTTQLVQSSRIGPHRLPNPAARPVNTSLAKSLGPQPHWSGSSRGQSDNAERQHEHQDGRDITSRQIEFSSSCGNQIDVEHPSDELDSHAPFSASDPPHGADPSTSAGVSTAGTTNDPAHGQHPNIHPD
ncbi:hypothetical protein OPQ81_000337 [Rhizoctonia solani]|nr:hypothetical protein OPQ81_000337 [Rhizoctonia solani]